MSLFHSFFSHTSSFARSLSLSLSLHMQAQQVKKGRRKKTAKFVKSFIVLNEKKKTNVSLDLTLSLRSGGRESQNV